MNRQNLQKWVSFQSAATLISNAGQNLQIDVVLMGIVVIGVVATLLDAIAVRAQAYLTRWSEVRQA